MATAAVYLPYRTGLPHRKGGYNGKPKQQYTVLYGRLSQEDERAGESNSILHQRELLESYAQAKGFENTLFLADDGYSGTNFERPSWKKIIEMIEAGEVSTLIVKDTSRLGREYLQVGSYMEIYFPQKNVRFIAVNDGVDSAVESSNDFNPIRNWANELHAKDTSRKVRAVKKLQAERAAREQALLDDIDTVWQEFSDAVILGDSRAVGFSYYSFLDASRVLASSGERIDAIDGHIEDLKKLAPAYIFLCYGINDLGWYGSAQDYADTLLEKIRLLRRELPEAVIVVSSILPAYEPAVSREKLWLQIPDYTAAVQAMCEENGVLFADNTQLSEDYADLWQPDGIHLLPEFYPHWAANLIFASWGEIADA